MQIIATRPVCELPTYDPSRLPVPATFDPLAFRQRALEVRRNYPDFNAGRAIMLGAIGGGVGFIGMGMGAVAAGIGVLGGGLAAGALAAAAVWATAMMRPQTFSWFKDARMSAGFVELARELPVPTTEATPERLAATARLARSARYGIKERRLSAEAARYFDALTRADAQLDWKLRHRVDVLVTQLFDEAGARLRSIENIDALSVLLCELQPDERGRLLDVFKPAIEELTKTTQQAGKWRLDALRMAMEGKAFRYGDVAAPPSSEERDPMHPARLRIEAVQQHLDEQLRDRATETHLYARARLSPPMTHEEVLRLAARYERLGYRVFLVPQLESVGITVCAAQLVPPAGFIEGKSDSFWSVWTPASQGSGFTS